MIDGGQKPGLPWVIRGIFLGFFVRLSSIRSGVIQGFSTMRSG